MRGYPLADTICRSYRRIVEMSRLRFQYIQIEWSYGERESTTGIVYILLKITIFNGGSNPVDPIAEKRWVALPGGEG